MSFTPAGCTIFLTGLSAAGKSTIAGALMQRLSPDAGRQVTLLDGDWARAHVSQGLGFSRADRDANIRRIGAIAAEVTRGGGIAVCAVIAPYDATRREVRRAIEQVGGFVMVYVSTPLDVCESRDPKGLYAKARAGLITAFTGVSDPYETPADADVVIDTTCVAPPEAADVILRFAQSAGRLPH